VIGLDTNVLVRYLTQDDPRQAQIAARLIDGGLTAEQPGFISAIVLAELLWVLEDLYSATREELAECTERLLRARQLVVEHAAAVQLAIRTYRRVRCGLVDCLIAEIARDKGCERVVTFDRNAAKSGLFEIAG
jgi:predicted nucleic-acid-binding protein